MCVCGDAAGGNIASPRRACLRPRPAAASQARVRARARGDIGHARSSQVKCICMGTHQLFPAPVLARWSVSFVLKPVPIPIYPMLGYLPTVF